MSAGPPMEARITEIRCRASNKYGSGYLLGGDIVITAAHVLVDRDAAVPDDLSIVARPFAARRRGEDYRPASLIWPLPASRLVDKSQPDLALLKLASPEPALAQAPPVPIGLFGLSNGRQLSVTAVGFPRFRYDPKAGTSVTHQIFADVSPLSGLAGLPGADMFEMAVKTTQRVNLEADEWKGISGSALFADDRLIGVVIVTVVDRRKNPIDFKAIRIPEMDVDPAFAQALRDVATFGTAPPLVRPAPRLDELICLLDRDNQESGFSMALQNVMQATDTRALFCIAAGPRHHLPAMLHHRFRRRTLPDFHQWPEESAGFRPLSLPDFSDCDAALATMRFNLAGILIRPGETVQTDEATIRHHIADESRHRLFFSELRPSAVQPGNRAATAAVLDGWLTFWGSLAGARNRPPVHILIGTGVERSDIDTLLDPIAVPPTIKLCKLPPFDFCTTGDLDDWLDARLKVKLGPTQQPHIDRLSTHMRSRFENDFSYLDFQREIAAFTKLTDSGAGER